MRILAACLLLLLLLSASASVARAQDGRDEARRRFDHAVELLRQGQFASAREELQRSLELYPTPGAAFNLSVALRGMGRPVEAAEVLDGLLEGRFGDVDAARRSEAERMRAEVRAERALLRIDVRGPPRAEVRIDGEVAGPVEDGAPLERHVDPGRRVVSARAPAHAPVEQAVDVGRGEHRTLQLRLDPLPAPAAPDDGSVLESPWLWVVAGVLVLGAGATVWWLTRDRTEEPASDPVFGTVLVLRSW